MTRQLRYMKDHLKDKNKYIFLEEYLRERPLFLSLTRAKEAQLYQKYVPFKKPILDLGCGDGFFAKVIRQLADHPERREGSPPRLGIIDVGLDIEGSRINEAKKSNIYRKLVVYNGKTIPFPNNSFSTVISNCVLEHIPDLDSTLLEVRRVLKKGGLFIITVMSAPWEEYLFGNIFLGDIYKKWMRKKQEHHTILDEKQWKEKFKQHKLKIMNETGFIDKSAARWIDFLHYVCIPNFVTYKIFHKWVLWPTLNRFIPTGFFANLLDKPVNSQDSGCIFFVLKNRKNE